LAHIGFLRELYYTLVSISSHWPFLDNYNCFEASYWKGSRSWYTHLQCLVLHIETVTFYILVSRYSYFNVWLFFLHV